MNSKFNNKWSRGSYVTKIGYVFKIVISYIISIFYKNTDEYWLMGLGDDLYDNNGKYFYEFMKEHHSDIKIFWICNKESIDYFSKYISKKSIIQRASIKDYLYALNAKVGVYSFSDKDIAPGLYRIVKNHKTRLVNLNHGFDGLKGMSNEYYKPLPVDLICAASSFEMEKKVNYCGASKDKVKVTGFPRFDAWICKDEKPDSNYIFYMPTWRDWYESNGLVWEETGLCKAIMSLNEEFKELLEQNDLSLVCKLHPRAEEYFKKNNLCENARVIIATEHDTVQKLLKEAKIVITDYSSIFWDSIYMNKPTILYWFDYAEYLSKRGLMVDKTFYNCIADTAVDVKRAVEKIICNRCQMNIDRDKYFNWIDSHNSERVYSAIKELCSEDNK